MPLISYAQNLEDVMLWRALGHLPTGFYVDVGANDPEIDSVTKLFYDAGWNGINIEPIKRHWEKLSLERPRDINIPIAAGNKNGQIEIFDSEIRGWSTVVPTLKEKLTSDGIKGSNYTVEVRPLKEIL